MNQDTLSLALICESRFAALATFTTDQRELVEAAEPQQQDATTSEA